MESSVTSILPNLGVGVVAILSLVYVTREFLKELKERETAMRLLEQEIRNTIMEQLTENTITMREIINHHQNEKLRT
jgi:hypothetical protein